MSNVIASPRSFSPPVARRHQPSLIVPNTDYLDLSYDHTRRALWIYLTDRAPAFVSLELIQDLLGVDNVVATSLATNVTQNPPVDFKIMASKRSGVFSLGGDLASFRFFIDQGNKNALAQYAHAALDAIWTTSQAANVEHMTTVALVQGEAQGGGFEAALAAQVLVAEKGAMFGFPEALFGMFPGMGGYALLAARTSPECARRLIGSTNRYSAEMLHEMGVVDVLAEKGKGEDTLNEWMRNASPESTAKYRDRFAGLNREQLSDSVDEWVDQALSLSQRQLRTMGYILEAQKRASEKPVKATITRIGRTVDFADLQIEKLNAGHDSLPTPLTVTSRTPRRFNDTEFVAFAKTSRPWIYENLKEHGSMLFRGFAGRGAESIARLSAALRTDRAYRAERTIPTPTRVSHDVFRDDFGDSDKSSPLQNVGADCAVFPPYKILHLGESDGENNVNVSLVNTRAIYRHLPHELIVEFESRGITYRRHYIDSATARAGSNHGANTWQYALKVETPDQAEQKCRENGLSYLWGTDGSLEVWNSAPACISHRETGERLWFNHVHAFNATNSRLIQRKSLMSKLFSLVKADPGTTATFSDDTAIPSAYIDKIASAHRRLSVEIALQPGDFLIIDNAMIAQGRSALRQDENLLISLF